MEKNCTLLLHMPMQSYLEIDGFLGGSMLNLVLNRPDKFKHQYIEGNNEEATEATKLGSLVHTLFMEPEKFTKDYHLIPDRYVNDKGKELQWRENKNYTHVKEDIEKAGNKVRITSKQYDEARKYEMALRNSYAGYYLEGAIIEPTFLCKVSDELKLKSRPDFIKDGIGYNVKSTKSAKAEDFYKSAIAFGYDISAALAAYCYEMFYKEPMKDYVFPVVEKSETAPVEIFHSNEPMYGEGSMTFLEFGALRLKAAIDKYLRCKKIDSWPAFESDGVMRVPYHAIKEYLTYND